MSRVLLRSNAFVRYDLRIMFSFVKHEGKEAILLETIGTHDEVY
jgi:mRNA-degrading endonuclease YafQ of YafQ-DinJ toxin-antitoxin module